MGTINKQRFLKLFHKHFRNKKLVTFNEINTKFCKADLILWTYYYFSYIGFDVYFVYNCSDNILCIKSNGQYHGKFVSKNILENINVYDLILRKNDQVYAHICESIGSTLYINSVPNFSMHKDFILLNKFFEKETVQFGKLKIDSKFIKFVLDKCSLLEMSTRYIVNNKKLFNEKYLNALNKDLRKLINE